MALVALSLSQGSVFETLQRAMTELRVVADEYGDLVWLCERLVEAILAMRTKAVDEMGLAGLFPAIPGEPWYDAVENVQTSLPNRNCAVNAKDLLAVIATLNDDTEVLFIDERGRATDAAYGVLVIPANLRERMLETYGT
jgi:hypothetical protein